jgi:hypothetical protein
VVNWIDGPPRRDIQWPDPEGAIEVTAEPGDAVFFDRRIWHTRSRNYSEHTRKAVFFGYTYRWTAIRDDIAAMRASDWFSRLTPVQQQLLGGAEDLGGDHAWGHDPATTPLYGWLKERGFLTPAHPPLKPLASSARARPGGAVPGGSSGWRCACGCRARYRPPAQKRSWKLFSWRKKITLCA